MLRGNSVVNNPIIADDSAVTLGVISRILIDSRLCRVAAFTLERASSEPVYVLPWMGVYRIEPDQVFAWAPTMIVQAEELFDIKQLLKQGTIISGTQLKSGDNVYLGTVSDFLFNRNNGVVVSYEVADGPFVDPETEHGMIPALANTQVEKESNIAYLPITFKDLSRRIRNGA